MNKQIYEKINRLPINENEKVNKQINEERSREVKTGWR